MTQWIEINSEVAFLFFAYLVFTNYFLNSTKGQLISKGLVDILNSSKKWNEENRPTVLQISQVDLFLFVFLKELKTPKCPFEIN